MQVLFPLKRISFLAAFIAQHFLDWMFEQVFARGDTSSVFYKLKSSYETTKHMFGLCTFLQVHNYHLRSLACRKLQKSSAQICQRLPKFIYLSVWSERYVRLIAIAKLTSQLGLRFGQSYVPSSICISVSFRQRYICQGHLTSKVNALNQYSNIQQANSHKQYIIICNPQH